MTGKVGSKKTDTLPRKEKSGMYNDPSTSRNSLFICRWIAHPEEDGRVGEIHT